MNEATRASPCALAIASALMIASPHASAGAFSLGIGTELSQVLLPSAQTGEPQAAYLGPGLLADARMRIGSGSSLGDFGVDFFGTLELAYAPNSAADAAEACRLRQYAGGLDLRTSILFVGAQVAQTHATVFSPARSATIPLTATSFGFRSGINWMLTDDASIMIGGVYQTATAYATDNGLPDHQPIQQWSAFVTFHFKAVSQGSNVSGAKR